MSDADTHIKSAREHIKDAIIDLNAILVLECDGHRDWDEDYKKIMYETYIGLLEMRKKL